jgi:hypothetical protein
LRLRRERIISKIHVEDTVMKIPHDENVSFCRTIAALYEFLSPSGGQQTVETITIALKSDQAEKLYAAIGRELAKGDKPAADGQSQFALALVAVTAGGAPPATTTTPAPLAPTQPHPPTGKK